MKKIVYVDMDNVLVDFESGIRKLSEEIQEAYFGKYDEVPGIFSLMEPVKNAIKGYEFLATHFDTYILSTSPWNNPTALNDKLDWVKKYLGKAAFKRVIFSHNKHLNSGDYLIDDRPHHNGADRFNGKLIHFTSGDFPDWMGVVNYFKRYIKPPVPVIYTEVKIVTTAPESIPVAIKKIDFYCPFEFVLSEQGILSIRDIKHFESTVRSIEEPRFPGDDRSRIYSNDPIHFQFEVQNKEQIDVINQTSNYEFPFIHISYSEENNKKKIVEITSSNFDFNDIG